MTTDEDLAFEYYTRKYGVGWCKRNEFHINDDDKELITLIRQSEREKIQKKDGFTLICKKHSNDEMLSALVKNNYPCALCQEAEIARLKEEINNKKTFIVLEAYVTPSKDTKKKFPELKDMPHKYVVGIFEDENKMEIAKKQIIADNVPVEAWSYSWYELNKSCLGNPQKEKKEARE